MTADANKGDGAEVAGLHAEVKELKDLALQYLELAHKEEQSLATSQSLLRLALTKMQSQAQAPQAQAESQAQEPEHKRAKHRHRPDHRQWSSTDTSARRGDDASLRPARPRRALPHDCALARLREWASPSARRGSSCAMTSTAWSRRPSPRPPSSSRCALLCLPLDQL